MRKYQSVQFFLETFGKWQFIMTLAGIKSKKRNFFKNDTLAQNIPCRSRNTRRSGKTYVKRRQKA
jgi:hypothetical protein